MTNLAKEFRTIALLRQSNAETRGVDAFALSLIKTERQIRRLFTYLIFQYSCFNRNSVSSLRDCLANHNRIYFDCFVRGIDAVSPRTIKQLIGAEHDQLRKTVEDAIVVRNKIFHGQVTDQRLSRKDLFDLVDQLTLWCRLLSESAMTEFGYDGFARNSYRKASEVNLSRRFKLQVGSIADYEALLKQISR